MSDPVPWIRRKLDAALLTPIRALRLRYVPLLLIYFAYGLSGFSAVALAFWEKDVLSLSATQIVSIGVWAYIPWTLKMIFGQMVDSVPIFGSRRKAYVYGGALLMAVGATLLAGMAAEFEWILALGTEYQIYLLATVLLTLGFVVQDVAADTMTTEVVDRYEIHHGKKIPRSEQAVQSDLAMVQVLGRLALSLAAFLVAGLSGWLAMRFSYAFIFWLMLGLPIISCLGAFFVRLEKPEHHKRRPLNLKILLGGIGFAIFSTIMAVFEFPYSQEIVFGVSFVLLVVMMFLVTQSMSPAKRKGLFAAMAALFLFRMTALSGVGPGLQWWMIDILGFDKVFFGVLRQIGAGVALLFLWLFSDFIANRPVRSVLIALVFLESAMALPDLALYYEVHEFFGLSARTVALFDTALESPLTDISMVPMLALIAFYAPSDYRGTWFAVGASFMNLALAGGKLLTKYLNQIFEVSREVLDGASQIVIAQDYSDLGWLMVTRLIIAFVVPLGAVLLFLRKPQPIISSEYIQEDISEQPPVPGQKEPKDIT